MAELADALVLGSSVQDVQVQVLLAAPKREAKKDIGCKSPVFSRLPRPVDE